MSLFKLRKNKSFNYKSRYNQEKISEDIEAQWNLARGDKKHKGFKFTTLPFLILLLVVALVLWYILNTY